MGNAFVLFHNLDSYFLILTPAFFRIDADISTPSEAADASSCSGINRPASHLFVRLQQARKLCLLQNHPFGEAPRAAGSLILEVDPMRPRIRCRKVSQSIGR